MDTAIWSLLPIELLEIILLWVPFSTLIQIGSIPKHCYDLLWKPSFTTSWLNNNIIEVGFLVELWRLYQMEILYKFINRIGCMSFLHFFFYCIILYYVTIVWFLYSHLNSNSIASAKIIKNIHSWYFCFFCWQSFVFHYFFYRTTTGSFHMELISNGVIGNDPFLGSFFDIDLVRVNF